METDYTYIGSELQIFEHAVNWKKYWRHKIEPFIGTWVLEVGAGVGATTQLFSDLVVAQWVALEPDSNFASILREKNTNCLFPANTEIQVGNISSFPVQKKFDTILYVDVLEHIEEDLQEVEMAARYLVPGGYLIVLSPAYQFLFNPFDEQIGHYRRYTKKTLGTLTPTNCRVVVSYYLDSCGIFVSLGNRLLLKSTTPSLNQIHFWDRLLVPVSRIIDRFINYQIGRSIVFVWQYHQ